MSKHSTRKTGRGGKTATLARKQARASKTAHLDWERLGRDLGVRVIL